MKKFVGLFVTVLLIGLIPGATGGAIAFEFAGDLVRDILEGIALCAILLQAEVVYGERIYRCAPGETPRPPRNIRNAMVNLAGFEVLALLSSLILGVPAAIAGGVVGYFLHAITLDAEIGYLVGGGICVARLSYWYWIGRKLQTPGYLQPYPTRFERILYVWLCRQILALSLGQVRIHGQERAKFDGRLIIGGNHQSGLDFLIARITMPFSFRQITQMKQLRGLQSGLGAFSGAFGVQSEGGRSKGNTDTVIDNCANALSTSQRAKLLAYPQGKLILRTIQHDDFRTGVIRIMQKTVEVCKGDNRIAFLPEAIYYWEGKSKPGTMRRFLGKGWAAFDGDGTAKYGATVVIGDPIPYATMPKLAGTDNVDIRAAINLVCDSIVELYAEARVRTERNTNPLCDAMRTAGVQGSAMLKLFEADLFTVEKLKGASAEALVTAGLSADDAAKVKTAYAA